MDKILLAICNGLSCFIICTILFQFMNERYKKSYSNKTLYIAAEIAMGITAFGINMLNFAILNLLIWFVGVGVTVYFLYYEDADRPIRRITECEFPYKSRVMGTSEPLKPLKAPYMARNPVKWGFFRLKGQEIPLKI